MNYCKMKMEIIAINWIGLDWKRRIWKVSNVMAICRIARFNSPILHLHPPTPTHLPIPAGPTFSFPFCPRKSDKFTHLPLLRPKPLVTVSSTSPSSSSSSSMENPPQGYRRNVGICLINSSKKIFSASRLDIPSAWQMPQGGIDEGEDPRSAAIRELREETGVSSAEIVAEAPYWLTYDFPPHVREKLNREWGEDWKGQAQKWFLLKFTGEDNEINLLGDGTEKAEFGEWSWLPPEQIIDLAVEFKKPVYKEVLTVFSPHLQC